MADDFYIADGKTYTRTTQNQRTLKLKEWGINESIFRTAIGSSAENIYPGQVFFINTDAYGCIDNANGVHSEEKIAVLSGSYVECLFMKPEERFVSVMERHFNKRLLSTHIRNARQRRYSS